MLFSGQVTAPDKCARITRKYDIMFRACDKLALVNLKCRVIRGISARDWRRHFFTSDLRSTPVAVTNRRTIRHSSRQFHVTVTGEFISDQTSYTCDNIITGSAGPEAPLLMTLVDALYIPGENSARYLCARVLMSLRQKNGPSTLSHRRARRGSLYFRLSRCA